MDSPIPSPTDPPLSPPRPFFLGASPRPRRSAPPPDSTDRDTRLPPTSFTPPRNSDQSALIPTHNRRNSLESIIAAYPAYASYLPQEPVLQSSGSLPDLQRPHAPFMSDSASSSSIYRNSAAANMIPRPQSQTFRAPFLSPASRPSSSVWSWTPPSQPSPDLDGSTTALHLPSSASRSNLRPSTLLVRSSTPNLPAAINTREPPNEKENSKEEMIPVNDHYSIPPPRARLAWWVTVLLTLTGVAGAALLCWTGVRDVQSRMLDEKKLCLVMNENWSSGQLDDLKWSRDVELGGFGTGEFEMTTASDKNVFIKNGQLYILPTLTSDEVSGIDQDGAAYDLEGCTGTAPPAPATSSNSTTTGGGNGNATQTTGGTPGNGHRHGGNGNSGYVDTGGIIKARRATNDAKPATSGSHLAVETNAGTSGNSNPCRATTNYALGTVINPVQSGRINTKGKVGIKYGRVEIRAKIARGDWLWPAVWMLPENNTYGPWPLSGEMDIMEARGNSPSYPGQGVNYVRASLNYGLGKGLSPIAIPGKLQENSLMKHLYGWFALKRTSFDQGFHTYAIEWDESFIRFYVDSRVRSVLEIGIGKKGGKKPSENGGMAENGGFWDKGKFPATAQNASDGQVVVVQNPWESGTVAAPFDQRGTSGWFPDELGNKPWYDGSTTAMRDFSKAQDQWYPTWPENEDDRAFRIASVKMWSQECSN